MAMRVEMFWSLVAQITIAATERPRKPGNHPDIPPITSLLPPKHCSFCANVNNALFLLSI
jgi:hypothetical protein